MSFKRLAAFGGSDRFVSDYLKSELLANLDAEDRRFLSRTAVLERMCGPLCDAVLASEGSAAVLESLEAYKEAAVDPYFHQLETISWPPSANRATP